MPSSRSRSTILSPAAHLPGFLRGPPRRQQRHHSCRASLGEATPLTPRCPASPRRQALSQAGLRLALHGEGRVGAAGGAARARQLPAKQRPAAGHSSRARAAAARAALRHLLVPKWRVPGEACGLARPAWVERVLVQRGCAGTVTCPARCKSSVISSTSFHPGHMHMHIAGETPRHAGLVRDIQSWTRMSYY